MKVLKFGGSSIADAARIKTVNDIIVSQPEKCVVVVSAFEGITDRLVTICQLASEGNENYKTELTAVMTHHLKIIEDTLIAKNKQSVTEKIKSLHDELEVILHSVFLTKELTPKNQDLILSFGERISSYIIYNRIEGSDYADSRDFIKTNSDFGNAKVNFEKTYFLIKKYLDLDSKVIIVPGFIGSNNKNDTTTLGRGGSDYTASVIAAALNAEILEIWTNVDGFLTADPRIVSKAHTIDQMSYAEAIELSHFGAKVIYTPTIQPVFQKNIPILVRNTLNLTSKGTWIGNAKKTAQSSLITGISSISDITLITLQGTGMVGVPGTAMRLFRALARASINVILITQASSEHSITFAIIPSETEKAVESINKEFAKEISQRHEINILFERDMSIIAIVGEGMKNTPGISATLFRALGRSGISVIAVAQGSSELNISVGIKKDNLRKAMNVIHEGFFLSTFKELNIFLVGTGTIGGQLLVQINKQWNFLMEKHHLKVKVTGIMNINGMISNENGIDIENYEMTIEKNGEKADINKYIERIFSLNLRNSVFIDCTASPDIADKYYELLNSFVFVVTANKIANSSEYSLYKKLKETALARGVKFLYETNVGAGLPIINTINDLIMSGDRILKIEAVLSGTLNFIFNTISENVSLSKAILMAKEKGYSEPDPRIDLSGSDVVRKLLILSREAGYAFEKTDVQVNNFLPKECFEGSIDNFWETLKKVDAEFEVKRKEVSAHGEKWRFVATLDNDKPFIHLITVNSKHPAFDLEGSNNIILITTERYKELPMVIKGYGAGAEVTAAGVFADIIRCANN